MQSIKYEGAIMIVSHRVSFAAIRCLVKQHFSLQKGCVTTRFLENPQVKRLRNTSYVVIVSFTGKLCTLFTPPRNGALVCITKGLICAIMCRKGTDFVFDVSMLYVCANAPSKWHYWSMLPYKSVTPGPNCVGKCSCFTLRAEVSLLHGS